MAGISFPAEEERILRFWNEIDAFHLQLSLSKGKEIYNFYDGPPFATGLPHYGHILTSAIKVVTDRDVVPAVDRANAGPKDTVTRYAATTGHYVERRFGWDTHGLPVEHEIDKKFGITSKKDVMAMGIKQYNEECRTIVMRYAQEWEIVITRLGRWIDFKDDYKTLYPSFMESVWWVFRQIYDKELVYRGFRVMPYSTGCTTPLSNFEAGQNYQDVSDPSIVVSFPLISDPETSLLAWTTTPWTLPSNLAICANPDFDYLKIQTEDGRKFIILENRVVQLFSNPKKASYTVLSKIKGQEMEGWEYVPLFPFFKDRYEVSGFRVVLDSYVTADDGTGLVHQAPAFGEDDYRVCLKYGIVAEDELPPCPIDDAGIFTSETPEYEGLYIKTADKEIQKRLKSEGRLIKQSTFVHSYPFCWRSDTPLIYRVVPSWFVRVADYSDKLIECLRRTNWVPKFVRDNRFENWLYNARDWNISRNRYWGTPIPLWVSDDKQEVICVGSLEELEKLSGEKVTDMHRDSIDHIIIPSKTGKGFLHRVDEVFDCWFESGSMPYSSKHYPFENKDVFESSFPAQFIAEGLDQTRGWFYTLLILGAHLFDCAPFENVIVNGIVLAADGKKMSKRLKNYPEPGIILNKYGADALRLYLISSPVVRAETLKFKEEGVREVISSALLPWWNSFKFFENQVSLLKANHNYNFESDERLSKLTNVMDRWILASCQSLLVFIKSEMAAYRLYTVLPRLLSSIENVTNWYIRFNRKRLKGEGGLEDTLDALNTLFSVLDILVRAMSSFTPFLSDNIYQRLIPYYNSRTLPDEHRSVHFLDFPEIKTDLMDRVVERQVSRMQKVINLARAVREKHNLSLKTPLKELIVIHNDTQYLKDLKLLELYITEELNVLNLSLTSDEKKFGVNYSCVAEWKVLGKKLGPAIKIVKQELLQLSSAQVQNYMNHKEITIAGHKLVEGDLQVLRGVTPPKDISGMLESSCDSEVIILLDINLYPELKSQRLAREVINRVQKLRKKAGLQVTDQVKMQYWLIEDKLNVKDAIYANDEMIRKALRGPLDEIEEIDVANAEALILEEAQEIQETTILLRILQL